MHVDQHLLAREGAQAEAQFLREQLDVDYPDDPERAIAQLEGQAVKVEQDLETYRLAAYRAEMLISALHHEARQVGIALLRARLGASLRTPPAHPSAPEE